MIYRDSGGPDPAKARQLAEELILRDEVQFLTGFTFTPNATSVADLITEADVPAVIMNAATAVITRQSELFVRASMTLAQQTARMAQWVADYGYPRVCVLAPDYGPGHDAEEQFIKTYTDAGGEIVDHVRVVSKSKLLTTVMGFTGLRGGQIRPQGAPIQGTAPIARVRAGLGYLPQEREIFPSLTCEENLAVAARPGGWTAGDDAI